MNRRLFLSATAAVTATTAALGFGRSGAQAAQDFEVTRSKSQWQAMLSDTEYRVMREEGTERAFTSPLNDEKRDGMFHCKGCDLALYAAEHKYDSGTGWPSFWQAQSGNIETKPDRSLFGVRTECHCRRCGSHMGHIFDDGPRPTGKRHCINGVSLTFKAA